MIAKIKYILPVIILLLSFGIFNSINNQIQFETTSKFKEDAVKQNLRDIRQLQIAYKRKYNIYSSNFQDLSIGHADPGFPLIIGDRVTVGHRCITHGCEIDDDCLIGMGAILMNGVKIGRGSIVGAGAVVLEGTEVPPFSMIAGSPAKILKTYEADILESIKIMSKRYVSVAEKYRSQIIDV